MAISIRENTFSTLFGSDGDIRGYFAPGRVNLIGEHIDYNGGHVLPCALMAGTYCLARRRKDRTCRLFSINCKKAGVGVLSLDDLSFRRRNGWMNYPLGIRWTLSRFGKKIPYGFDILISGNIPGSGLSSSASREVVIATMLNDRLGFGLTPVRIAKLAQYSENNFNRTNCGIMDQFSSAMGKKDNAIFLDCKTLEYKYVPVILTDYSFAIADSNRPHSLSHSHYNERRKECEEALRQIQKGVKVTSLCQLSVEQFEQYRSFIQNPILQKRAKHAVYEEQRVKDALAALEKKDLHSFGSLRNESGDSLRYDYDATCFEIDVLVDEARKVEGVLGSRETGGGWGGNTISLVKNEFIPDFLAKVSENYHLRTGLKAKRTVRKIGSGAGRLF